MTWNEIQKQSDIILSCGLNKLKTESFSYLGDIKEKGFGNYLISLDGKALYIGEGSDLLKRLKQQFAPKTSTFYKNFKGLNDGKLVTIDNFQIQCIQSNIGRKEIEEFGIVNLPTTLNRFQIGKRSNYCIADQNGLWNTTQEIHSDILKQGENIVLNSKFTNWFDAKIISNAGLYLVIDKSGALLYIGESSNVGERIITHSKRSYFSALRRHIGTNVLDFQLKEMNGKFRYFSEIEEMAINDYLKKCKLVIFPVSFGRYELEEYLIQKYKPVLNRKNNKD
ncbi:GIY-YIG nuclease family protein [Flavobacterium sp. MFBS3-15]|uniref:GIY-YIG nuclease family protein n=1 Tax=Flavobacterium sp. MFBS3-15 TaxID=2989816 RepID=UPI0022369120|nr:GIY-YIG nuclease family protein [Flavobacterium sp. MFBS3-15]MCW4470768.1 GIY-YIG nuclease family protein [Flavobacterium sp. MFBS3-15]